MLIVAAIIEKEGHFLLARRAPHKPDPGVWEFPGGKVEPPETPQQALARELLEELEIHARVGPLFYETSYHGIHFQGYRTAILAGTPQLRDHDQVVWLQPGHFDPYRMHDFDQEVAALLGKPWP